MAAVTSCVPTATVSGLRSALPTRHIRLSQLACTSKPALPQMHRRRNLVTRAVDDKDDSNVGLLDKITQEAAPQTQNNELPEALKNLSPQQQQQLGQIYQALVLHPEAKIQIGSWQEVQALFDQYQVLLWQPAELLNGRMAMIGFTAAVANELATGQSIWQQLYNAPFAYLGAYGLVVAGAILNRQFGSPTKGIGPFTRTAELWNGRFAMLGYAILAWVEYNQELRRAALIYAERLAHMHIPGVNA